MRRVIELEIAGVAHGGHCVARHDGRVVFVRHTLPGETVRAEVTQERAKLWRADAVEVISGSTDRVPSLWPAAGPGGVGGGELAHVSLEGQRRWKAQVVAEQLRRLGGVEREVVVQGLPGDDTGLGYRTRIELATDGSGRLGMHGFRSHQVLPLDDMPLAVHQIAELDLFSRRWPGNARLEVAAPSDGLPLVLVNGEPYRDKRRHLNETFLLSDQRVSYRVAADGFWQVHRRAPQRLTRAVMDQLADLDLGAATALDLYSGVGLFTLPLARMVGEAGHVWSVESDPGAVRNARRNLHEYPWARLLTGDVATVLAGLRVKPDIVVLDPPRAGAKARVVNLVARMRPRRVVYVACDPAALARDVATFADAGYRLTGLWAYDFFPMTHHVECVATFGTSP